MPSILHTKQGGTGSNSVPLENQIPIGDSNGNYQPGDISSVGFLLQTNIGVVQLPTVTKNVDGIITVGDDGIINLCETADGRGNIKQFTNIIGDTLTPTDNAISFLYADYNSGSPIYKISATNQIFLTDNTLAPVIRISRYGTRLHFEEYDEYATLTANKLVLKDSILNGARRLSGLTLSTEATRKSIVSAGQGVFSLQYYLNLEENRAGITGSIYELYPTAGVWGENLVTEYDSSYYSDGTNRIALGNNKYVAKYFWRDIGDDNEVYYIHGQQYNTESQAFNENVPVAPFFMTGHSIYVGKIVIQKDSLNGIAYPRNWEGSVQSATVSNHNDLSGIQGGTANEYYHLTYSQSTDLTGGGVSTLHKHTALSTPDGTSNFVYTDNSGKLHVDGDIIQNGSAYETHAEQVYTKKDLIITRDGAISGLGVGEYTGFQAKLYDGVNDGQLIFDKDGWAKVGDIGNLVTLAGREDSPIDQAFGYWDDATKIFKTKTISSSDLTDNSSIVKTSGIQTIEGAKTFSDTIIGSINGNAGTVTNGVYTTGDQTIAGVKTFSSSPVVPNATTATQAVNYGQVVKNTGNETVAGVKTFSSSPIVPTPDYNSDTTVPATTAWVTDRIEGAVVDNTSRVAEYTGDGIPMIPDNAAGTTYRSNFATTDSFTSDGATFLVSGGLLQVTHTKSAPIVYRAVSATPNGKMHIARVRAPIGALVKLLYYTGSTYSPITAITGNGLWQVISGYLPSGSAANFFYIQVAGDPGAVWFLSDVYIGTGAYDTPALDRSGNGNSLALTAVTPVNGKYGKELAFNGTTSFLQASSPVIGTTGTVAIRFKRGSIGTAQPLISNETFEANTGLILFCEASNVIRLRFGNAGSNVVLGSVPSVSDYYSILFALNGTTLLYSLNGEAWKSTTIITPVAGTLNLYFGRSVMTYGDSIISHFRYDSRIWTADEVRSWSLNPISIDSRV